VADKFWPAEATEADIQYWARATRNSLCPDSPLAVLRFREIHKSDSEVSGVGGLVTTAYRYAIVSGLDLPSGLGRRVSRLRAAAGQLRFREGQFGGHAMPENVVPFELAAPQTIGVQPIYMLRRPVTALPAVWPWGLSALRPHGAVHRWEAGRHRLVDRRQTGNGGGPLTLWWQAPRYGVQYRSATTQGNLPVWGLPTLYRAAGYPQLVARVARSAVAERGLDREGLATGVAWDAAVPHRRGAPWGVLCYPKPTPAPERTNER